MTAPLSRKRPAEVDVTNLQAQPSSKVVRTDPDETDEKIQQAAQSPIHCFREILREKGFSDFKPWIREISTSYKMKKGDSVFKFKVYQKSFTRQMTYNECIVQDLFGPHPETRGELLVQQFPHPRIATVLDRFYDPTGEYLGEIFNFIPGEDLYFHLFPDEDTNRVLSKEKILSYSIQIAEILVHLHKNGIVYRDLKIENLILSPETDQIYLIDLATAKKTNNLNLSPKGTINSMAPEIFLQRLPTSAEMLCKLDCFSFGLLIHILFSQTPPFSSALSYSQNSVLSLDNAIPLEWQELIRSLLAFRPEDRPTMEQVLEILKKMQGEDLTQKLS